MLDFIAPAGSCTGAVLPTGNAMESIDGVRVSLVDFSIPVVLIPASEVGKSGYESKAELDADTMLLTNIERLRRKAAARMGLPDRAFSVVPKVALLAAPREGGSITSRFYVPWNCHVAHSTTGGLCIAAATHIAGTVAAELAAPQSHDANTVIVEHPSGRVAIQIHTKNGARNAPHVARASVVLTARPLFDGFAFPNAHRP